MANRHARVESMLELQPDAYALPPGMLWLARSRILVAADLHLAYEDVIGGALPTWSTTDVTAAVLAVAQRWEALEIVLLGDVIHGSRMSDGAARAVAAALERLRTGRRLTLVAGNHEGRTRGAAVLGETVEFAQRDGWLLVHGDRAPLNAAPTVIGHLHPSVHLGGGESAPAFVAGPRIMVLPALTPYSKGLSVLSGDFARALRPYESCPGNVLVAAVAGERLYPFGTLSALRETLVRPYTARRDRYRRNFLGPDSR